MIIDKDKDKHIADISESQRANWRDENCDSFCLLRYRMT